MQLLPAGGLLRCGESEELVAGLYKGYTSAPGNNVTAAWIDNNERNEKQQTPGLNLHLRQ